MSLTLYRIEGMFPLYRIGACFRKPDSGHADTTSLTIRVRRASQNAMKPRIQCVLTP